VGLTGCSDDDGVVVRDDLVIRTVDLTTTVPSTVPVPDDFPDVPLPTGMHVEDFSVLDQGAQPIWDVTGWHPDDPVEAGLAYEDVLEDAGYVVGTRNQADESLFFSATDNEWFVSVGFFADPVRLVGTSVGLTVTPKPTSG